MGQCGFTYGALEGMLQSWPTQAVLPPICVILVSDVQWYKLRVCASFPAVCKRSLVLVAAERELWKDKHPRTLGEMIQTLSTEVFAQVPGKGGFVNLVQMLFRTNSKTVWWCQVNCPILPGEMGRNNLEVKYNERVKFLLKNYKCQ